MRPPLTTQTVGRSLSTLTKNMKRHILPSKLDVTKFQPEALRKQIEENQKLRNKLCFATERQHQEQSRAIQLKEKNCILKRQLHEAKTQACKLRDQNNILRVKNLYDVPSSY